MVLSRKLRKAQKKAQNKSNPFNPDTNVQFPSLDMVRQMAGKGKTLGRRVASGLARGDMARKKRAQMLKKRTSRKPMPLKRFRR